MYPKKISYAMIYTENIGHHMLELVLIFKINFFEVLMGKKSVIVAFMQYESYYAQNWCV